MVDISWKTRIRGMTRERWRERGRVEGERERVDGGFEGESGGREVECVCWVILSY